MVTEAQIRAIAVWVDSLDAKEILLEHEPELFFTTPHYDGHSMLLVRLQRLDAARARGLIEESYRLRIGTSGAKAKRKSSRAR